jgi:hypothetical protein
MFEQAFTSTLFCPQIKTLNRSPPQREIHSS